MPAYFTCRANTIRAEDFAPQYDEHVKHYWAVIELEASQVRTALL